MPTKEEKPFHNYVLRFIYYTYPRTFLKLFNLFCEQGSLLDEGEVLDWMIEQKNDNSIEEINRERLFKYIESKEFLAVIFCKFILSPMMTTVTKTECC